MRNPETKSRTRLRSVFLSDVHLGSKDCRATELLQFLAFVVVAGTLFEGLALPWIIRRLRLPPPNSTQERVERHTLLAEAQTAGLARLDAESSDTDDQAALTRLRINATFLSEALQNPASDDREPSPAAYNRLRRAMLTAERDAVLAARDEGRYPETAVRSVLRSIDAEETALRAHAPDSAPDGA